MPAPLKTFIIYSRHDSAFKDELLKHLDAFVRKDLIRRWVDSDLLPGEDWEKRIEEELETAHLVLMLVSADALNSTFIQQKELKTALEKKQSGAARVAPILVRDCLWDLEDDLAALQMLPKDNAGNILAVEAWMSSSSAWAQTCRELRKLIDEIRAKLAEEEAAAEQQRKQEQDAAEQRAAAERIEKARHQKDERAWAKLKREIEAAAVFEDKKDLIEIYLDEPQYQNHREAAEGWLHDLLVEEELRRKREDKKKKAAAQVVFRNGDALGGLPAYAPEMVFVEGGSFEMGSTEYTDEQPIRTVKLSSFWMSKYPVTFEEYKVYCQDTGTAAPSDEGWGEGRRPVINVSWEEAVKYGQWLSEKTGKTFRLPTEAQWEYVARGGNLAKGYKFSGSDKLNEVGWYWENSGDKPLSGNWSLDRIEKNNCRTHPVGGKKANELGLYDMSGNVWEWCYDWYAETYAGAGEVDPVGPASGAGRVCRGGSAWLVAVACRPAYRHYRSPAFRNNRLGFRLVVVPLQLGG